MRKAWGLAACIAMGWAQLAGAQSSIQERLNSGWAAPPSAQAVSWASQQVVAGEWTMLLHDERGVVLVKPPRPITGDKVAVKLRFEFREPIGLSKGPVRSAEGEIEVFCNLYSPLPAPRYKVYEGQNLTGKSFEASMANSTPLHGSDAQAVSRLLSRGVIDSQCLEVFGGNRRFAPDWRGLTQEGASVTLMKPPLAMADDLTVRAHVRIESSSTEGVGDNRWRSALGDLVYDCTDDEAQFSFDGYQRANIEGPAFQLFKDERVRFGEPQPPSRATPGARPYTSHDFFIAHLITGMRIACGAEIMRRAERLTVEGSSERAQATAFAAQGKLAGWILPILTPRGAMFLGQEVSPAPNGERVVQVREEFVRPILVDGKPVRSQVHVFGVQCGTRKVRVLGELGYADPRLGNQTVDKRDFKALSNDMDYHTDFYRYFAPACAGPGAAAAP